MSRNLNEKRGVWFLAACICASAILSPAPARGQCGGFTITTDPCLLICPSSDEVFKVLVVDAASNVVCLPPGQIYLDFAGCGAIPCPGEEPNWPLVYADSCNAAGEHCFTVDAGLQGCTVCQVPLVVNGVVCQTLNPHFFDTDGDLCVTAADYVGGICNDYDCNGAITAADQAIFNTHLGHCCRPQPCVPGKAFCDSVFTDPCILVCPLSDEVFKVTVKDSCGNPVCLSGAGIFLDFAGCPAIPCPNEEPNWPLVYADSCDVVTGTHYFTVDAGLEDCTNCPVPLVVDGVVCRTLLASFFDTNGDLCVTPNDFVGGPCNDYDCDGTVTAADQAKFNAHLDHCCPSGPCPPGPPFCDSVSTDRCLLVCPLSDEVFKVTVKDSCGNPICLTGAGIFLDFANCPAIPCPGEEPNWPLVYSDSCDVATGTHYFTVDASALDCLDCQVPLVVNGVLCTFVTAKFFDTNGDLCVTPNDFVGGPCNDYDCDGTITAADQSIFNAHLDHCCPEQPCVPGKAFCDSVVTDPCILVCPLSDEVFKVTVRDSCGNPVCLSGAGIYLDFAGCPAIPCPDEEPNWPLVYSDSCDAATGTHYFTVDAGLEDCTTCPVTLVVDGVVCRTLLASFFDTNGDLCVTPNDFVGGPCNDYDCDGAITAVDQGIFNTHLNHCCLSGPCVPGPPFCDSTYSDPCLLVCPNSDEVFRVIVKDSCGNPICNPPSVGPAAWLDFTGCPARPCGNEEPAWPIVYPDSCDPATGAHYFTVDASLLDCSDCVAVLYVGGKPCRNIPARFFDTNGDGCVKPNDFAVGALCNDYNCDGTVDATDNAIFKTHLCHCCRGQCIIALTGDVNGDNVITSADIIWMVNHIFKGRPPPLPCPAAGDVNCDGVLTSADIIVQVNYVFKSGPPPCDVCTIIPAKWICCPY